MKANKISLFSIMLVCGISVTADAKVTVRKSGTYADAYNQVIAVRQQAQAAAEAQQAMTPENLPVQIDDEVLAREIIENKSDTVTMETLEDCSLIYPNGDFKWAVPESGNKKNQEQQCVAVVELREVDTNKVLATTTLAAGDTMLCNIDYFPQSGWKSTLETVTLPADAAPTEADVEKVMNEEQKQNAGFKIAAAALLSGIAGNMLAPKSAGDGKLVGTNNRQLADTAISATAGAGVMAASVYSGKVAGDTIKSTAINAASGAVVGNMVAGQLGSGATLDVKRCRKTETSPEQDCIPGQVYAKSQAASVSYKPEDKEASIYLVNSQKNIFECTPSKQCNDAKDCPLNIDGTTYQCKPISSNRLINIKLGNNISADEALFNDSNKAQSNVFNLQYFQWNEDERYFNNQGTIEYTNQLTNNMYFIVYGAFKPAGAKPAYAIFDEKLPLKPMGFTQNDWTKELNTPDHSYSLYLRNPGGSVGDAIETTEDTDFEFVPSTLNATDGAIIDFSNAARRKSTLTGAATGGALGGFSAYQGAKTEVQERWVAAQREYSDSLDRFWCTTGKRPLSRYNDPVLILDNRKK